MKYFGTVATNKPDQDGERFSDEALAQIAQWAPTMPIAQNFDGVKIGHITGASLQYGVVHVQAEGDLPVAWYAVPQVAFDLADRTEENGIITYHRVKLMGFGLTQNPSDPHLQPLSTE